MANVKIPYALIPAVSVAQRRAHARLAIARPLPRLERVPVDSSKTLYLACYGPSLRRTYQDLRGKSPIIAMSGATRWLADRGIVADYALEMDPRSSQLVVSLPPVPGVTYLIASCVVPEYFDQVCAAGNRVVLWHTVNSNFDDELAFISEADPGQLVVHGGSTVGLTALHIGGLLGYTRFEIHGMDGSFDEAGARHAAVHGGKTQPANITWSAGCKPYRTSKIMSNAVAETINTAKNFPILTIWHGDGLTQALIRKSKLPNAACADETEKVARMRGIHPRVVKIPPMTMATRQTFWQSLIAFLHDGDLAELIGHIRICEPRRKLALYQTGTVPFESAVALRALVRFYEPKVVVEVGTFIGTSTLALAADRIVYTCDQSNDCVPSSGRIVTHPYQSSTQMLRTIREPVDLFFFDGRIQHDDIIEIQRLMTPGTVFVFDDYVGHEKGVVNVEAMRRLVPHHQLLVPDPGPSTLAVLVPFAQHVGER